MNCEYTIVIHFPFKQTIDTWCSKIIHSRDIFTRYVNKPQVSIPEKPHFPDYRFAKITIQPGMRHEPVVSRFMGHGIIRLFREFPAPETPLQVVSGDGTTLCIVAVPEYISSSDLVEFVGDFATSISHIRMLFNETGKYMVLLKFKECGSALRFKETFDGTRFNQVDPETCHVVSIKEIVFATGETSLDTAFSTSTAKELPTCAVCLERLDSEVSGVFTIPCQHTFHCQCLAKWKDVCPVCRFSIGAERATVPITASHSSERDLVCDTCHNTQNLWCCLVCGHVGCGRYHMGHAMSHYQETGHCFSMELSSQRVWDYSSDSYVHRIVQSEDGKLVQVQPTTGSSKGKPDEYELEYTQILVSQLKSQQEYYESQQRQLQLQCDQLQQRQSKEMEVSKKVVHDATEKLKKLQKKYDSLHSEYQDEKLMCGKIQEKLEFVVKEKDEMKKQVDDLAEQVRDLMFYLESQERLKDASDDVKEGKLVIRG